MFRPAQFVPFLVLLVIVPASADEPKRKDPLPVRRMLHINMQPELPSGKILQTIDRIRPDIVVLGVFDQRLYATAFPSNQPLRDPNQLLAKWSELAKLMHARNIRVIGQMELFAITDRPADLKERSGFIGYHDKGWDERRLGQRIAKTAAELLEEPDWDPSMPAPKTVVPQGDALARCGCRVNTKALNGCVNKPAWRETQKRMVKAAIDIGVDGFITNRNYIGHCGCEHCRTRFRSWLKDRYTAAELNQRFGIRDLEKHPLTCIVGAHRELETVPDALVLEKIRFAHHMVKEFFDEVYIAHGRTLKPDLFAAQWNHLAFFDELHLDRGHLPPATRTQFAHVAADERWSLPANLWGREESLIWYCNWGTTQNTIMSREYAGDAVLYAKYVRAMARGTPYVINKYDFYRPRNMTAEAAALGAVPNAIATPLEDEADRAVMVRYFDFLGKYESLYRPVSSYAEVGLIVPRRALNSGDASPLEYVEAAGRAMIREHILFDMLPDDLLAESELARYRAIIVPSPEWMHEVDRVRLEKYCKQGGKLMMLPVTDEDRGRAGACTVEARRQLRLLPELSKIELPGRIITNARTDRGALLKAIRDLAGENSLSKFEAPWTVQVHVYAQAEPRRLVLHLVNYNHDESGAGKSVTDREAPIAAKPVDVSLRLPEGFKARSVRFLSPDEDGEKKLDFKQDGGRLSLRTPRFDVYGVCVIEH